MGRDVITFTREKDLIFKGVLGQGATGKTVLLFDDIIDEFFVCKKYSPYQNDDGGELFRRFIDEIKILHCLFHPNIVRVFNYFVYQNKQSGYILMEFVNGKEIDEYLDKYPEKINEIFIQTIKGFKYLEENSILNRDIRPQNILVNNEGVVKIIDFGFGKEVTYLQDIEKSISLNWWCEPPNDFKDGRYDIGTEVYFVGKLFEQMILEKEIENFKYLETLTKMCKKAPEDRLDCFSALYNKIEGGKVETHFSDDEIKIYREFSNGLDKILSEIKDDTKYISDVKKIEQNLEELYRKSMLEEFIPDNKLLVNCFLWGS